MNMTRRDFCLGAAAVAWLNEALAEPLMGAAAERAAEFSSRVITAAVAEAKAAISRS